MSALLGSREPRRTWSWLLPAVLLVAGFALGWLCRPDGDAESSSRATPRRLGLSPRPLRTLDVGDGRVRSDGAPRAPTDGRGSAEGDEANDAGPTAGQRGTKVYELIRQLQTTTDPADAVRLARELVLRGGTAGLEAVKAMACSDERGIEFRVIGIEALALAPVEFRGRAAECMLEVLESNLPAELELPVARAYAALLGRGAVPALVAAVRAGRVHADIAFDVMHQFVGFEHLPMLKQLATEAHDVEAQRKLLRAIGYAAGAQAIPLVLEWLRAPPPGMRRDSLGWALGRFAQDKDLPELWAALAEGGGPGLQSELARTIARVGGEPALEQLLEMAGDPSTGLSSDAMAYALEGMASPETVPLMTQALSGMRTLKAAERLATAIARVGGDEGVELLLAHVEAGGPEASRWAAVRTIQRLGSPKYAEVLGRLFQKETDPQMSVYLAEAVLRLDPQRGKEELFDRLTELPAGRQRAAIAEVYERYGGVESLPVLRSALRDETDRRTQWHLARAIAIRGLAGVETLGRVIQDVRDPERRVLLLRGALSIDAANAAVLAPPLLGGDPDPDVRVAAARALGRSRAAKAGKLLRQALEAETHPDVRQAITAALEDLEG